MSGEPDFATYQITASENLRFASVCDLSKDEREARISECEFWARKAFEAADNPFERLHAMMMFQTAVSMRLLCEAEIQFHKVPVVDSMCETVTNDH